MRALERVVIGGPSMRPTLDVGDVVLVRPTRRVRCGDVLVHRSGDQPICHRALLVVPWPGGARIVHRGDARGAGASMIHARAVVGRVVAVERPDGARDPVPRRRPSVGDLLTAGRVLGASALRQLRGAPLHVARAS